ncbi:hypothetical protein OG920_13610 [Streptomyces europaeiscabiei]|uniref:hypothetical protein n=1 Tax=Streptomyces europaeiscabiei TaxID=146819 RepID=UPI0030E2F820
MGTTSRLSPASSAPAADEPVEAPALGPLCVGSGEADGDGEPDACDGEGEGDGLFVGLGDAALPPGGAGAGAPPPPSLDGSTGEASPSGDVSGALARRSSGSARFRSGVSYENRPLANPAAAITPAAAVPARATTSPARRRRRRPERPADGEESEVERAAGAAGDAKGVGAVGMAPEAGRAEGGDAYGEGDAGAENSAWVEAALDVLDVLGVLDALGASDPARPPPRRSNIRTSVASGPIAVAAVVTGMAIVEV